MPHLINITYNAPRGFKLFVVVTWLAPVSLSSRIIWVLHHYYFIRVNGQLDCPVFSAHVISFPLSALSAAMPESMRNIFLKWWLVQFCSLLSMRCKFLEMPSQSCVKFSPFWAFTFHYLLCPSCFFSFFIFFLPFHWVLGLFKNPLLASSDCGSSKHWLWLILLGYGSFFAWCCSGSLLLIFLSLVESS